MARFLWIILITVLAFEFMKTTPQKPLSNRVRVVSTFPVGLPLEREHKLTCLKDRAAALDFAFVRRSKWMRWLVANPAE